jgi:hypothetical protein
MRIGFIGAPGAGKDALAEFFVSKKEFKRFAFADQIKEEFYAHSGFNEEEFKNARGTPLEEQIRKGLWAYSAEKTKEDKLYFISPVMKEIRKTAGSIVITDVRTPRELWAIELGEFQPVLILRNYKEELKGDETYIKLEEFCKELEEKQ